MPAGTWLEQDHIADNWKRHGYVFARQKCVDVGEAWQDHKIFLELGKRMGQQRFPTVQDALDYILEPAGITWEQFKEQDYLHGEMVYQKYKERGFSTSSRGPPEFRVLSPVERRSQMPEGSGRGEKLIDSCMVPIP